MTEVQLSNTVVLDIGSDSAFAKQEAMANAILAIQGKIVPVQKVARAGATTSLIKQAIEAHKKVVIIEPTHRIGEDTVSKAVQLSNNKEAKVLQLLKNSEVCKKLSDECSQNTRLQKMKWLLRPEDCQKCTFHNDASCELQNILNCDNWAVLVVTYQKLKALILSEQHSKISQALLKMIRNADIAIFDEYTTGLLGLTPSVELSDGRLESLADLIFDGYDEWWEKVLDVSSKALEFSQQLDAGRCDKFCNPLSEEELLKLNMNFSGMWNKVKRLTAKGIDTEFLQDMLQLICCKELLVHKDRKENISLRPVEALEKELSFINTFADEFALQNKLSILVDAHLPEFDLQQHFKSRVEPFMWGDPNNTNSSIVYFCDSRKISEADVFHQKTRVYLQESIREICSLHKNVGRPLIVCINKAVAEEVERWHKAGSIPDVNVTWYRSTITKGVQAEGNVQIMIGAPYIPLASYYHKVAKEAGADKTYAWRMAYRASAMHNEWINASNRVKDPSGCYQSYVYCLGITRFEVMNFLNLQGALYESGEVQKPSIVSFAKTGLEPKAWVDMTRLYQQIGKKCSENDMQFLLELTRVFTKADKKVRVQEVFRSKAKEATEVFLENADFLMSIDIYIKKQGRGFILVLNDRNP